MIEIDNLQKQYIWKKIEYTKRKKAESEKSKLYNILHDDNIESITKEDLQMLFNALEYTFKQKIKGISKGIDKFEYQQVKQLFSKL